MPGFEVTVCDFPELKDRTRVLLEGRPPDGAQCLRCGDLTGLAWRATCGHCFCNHCKDTVTRGHVLTCPVHFVKTPTAKLKRTDHGFQETRKCPACCAWTGCTVSGILEDILKHCESCPKKPRIRRNYSWQCSDGEMEDNLHGGLVKIVKPPSPTCANLEISHPPHFPAAPQSSCV